MSIELKVGNWYRTYGGKLVRIDAVDLSSDPKLYTDEDGHVYTPNGRNKAYKNISDFDITREIKDGVLVFQTEPLTEATLTPWISEIVYTNEHTSTNIELPMTDDQIKATVEDILVNRSGVQTVRVYKLVNTVSRKTSITWE